MAKKKVVVTTATKKRVAPTVSKTRKSAAAPRKSEPLIFGRENYLMILVGIGLMMLGLFLMSGGAMPSPDVWDESIIYSGRRTIVAPIVILLGLIVNLMAIFRTPKMETGASAGADL